ncbi:S8 family serine peptidase, partial [Actinocorallia aurea]
MIAVPSTLPAQAVPGLTALHRHTLGDPRVVVGIVDGPPDLAHPCLAGADLEVRTPWWSPAGPVDDTLREHGTFTASVLAGRPGTVLPGLVPGCRVIALGRHADMHVSHDPHWDARAIEELIEAGSDIIQYAPAHHAAAANADPLLERAVVHAIEAGVLVTMSAGDVHGRCGIAPTGLPGALLVDFHRADGVVSSYSNYGPAYAGR